MLKINGKTFMNIQEAVQWLLDNNALPYQCTANYAPLTEIGLGTIVNPSPAKVRIGSLIFFADSKVSTVVGITETGFICSDEYNNLVDDVAYVTNVAIDASGHLITTMSDGQTIDAGLIKQVSSFSIDASQHLIVTYNDGSTADLGGIFSGNVTISGSLTVTGAINGESNPSVKPIYWHGLEFYKFSETTFQFLPHILNNSTELINTPAKFKAWAESIDGIITVTGEGFATIDGNIVDLLGIRKYADNTWIFMYKDNTGGHSLSIAGGDFSPYFDRVDDYINKIN